MEKIINRNIKELILSFPEITNVLDSYGIGCTTCNVGTCKLGDIIEIHALSEPDEHALFSRIAAIIFPGQSVTIPKLPRKTAIAGKQKKLSPPMQMLVEEHKSIKLVLAAIPSLIASLETELSQKKELFGEVFDFIRKYADRFHHAKEEDILFKLFDESAEIIATMHEEHEIGRKHVRQAASAIDTEDHVVIRSNLAAYAALLTEHIRKEDEILYP